jgi:hypothetical protein
MSIFKYAPKTTNTYTQEHGALRDVLVKQYIAHTPGNHPEESPVKNVCYALELRTDFGTRWYGFAKLCIDGSLQMACELLPGQENDEVIMGWDDAPAF